jgi:NAD(P)-dependent dehydrogenase (short-subunit alcohol dehydrogenase family)
MRWLITGANRGIGLALAQEARRRGHDVIGTARDVDDADLLRETGARVLPLDVTSDDSARALVQALGETPIDVLVNNAGMLVGDALGEFDFARMDLHFQVNAIGPVRVANALLPLLRTGQAKKIVCISSQMGSIADNSSGGYYAYRMSKAALNMAVRSMGQDLQRGGFTVVALCPGWVSTDMGGPRAPVSPAHSAEALVTLVQRLGPSDTGHFFNRHGEPIAW